MIGPSKEIYVFGDVLLHPISYKITKHYCQTCHALREMYSHHTYPQTTALATHRTENHLQKGPCLYSRQSIVFRQVTCVALLNHTSHSVEICALQTCCYSQNTNLKTLRSAIVHRISSKGLEYTSKQYQSQRNNQCLQDSIKNTSFKAGHVLDELTVYIL